MPRYNYACTDCGPFEAWASIDASDDPTECPICGGMGGRALAAPFVGSGGSRPEVAPACGMGACALCAPAAD